MAVKDNGRIVAMACELSSTGPRFDVTKASEFGRVATLLRDGEIPTFHLDRIRGRMIERLDEIGFSPRRDYAMLTGGIVMVCVMIATISTRAALFGDPVRILIWDAKRGEYVSKLLPTDPGRAAIEAAIAIRSSREQKGQM